MDRPSSQRRQGERRRLWDRRAPEPRRTSDDRRRHERRSLSRASQADRRGGPDRRSTDRRTPADRRGVALRRHGRRRRETPTPFTVEQIAELRVAFAAPGLVACPACGSRFTLGPPRRRGLESARRVMCLGCSRAAVVPFSRSARILVVGQRGDLRESVRGLLANAGHEVIEAPDGAVALVAYQTVPSDVVILDAVSPGRMEAGEFLRRLRRIFPDARVVAMAGRASATGVNRAAITQGLGATRTIHPPLSGEALLRIVDEARA